MTAPRKPELILSIHMTEEKDYDHAIRGTFEAYVYSYKPPQGADAPLETLYGYESPLARFGMRATYGRISISNGEYYGWEWGFAPEGHFVTPREAKEMHATLQRLAKAVDKLTAQHGQPQTLGQYVIQLMHACGISKACWQKTGYNGERGWRISWVPEDIRYHIDRTIFECIDRQKASA